MARSIKRNTFLKLTSAIALSPLLAPFNAMAKKEKLINWAGNIEFSSDKISHPKSVKAIQNQVGKMENLKVLGTRHCFNTIADSKHGFLSMANRNKIISLDKEGQKLTVEGGTKYGELAPFLHQNGFALHNLASLPHISVAGGCSTATHGSGSKNGNLSTAVTAMELVAADGSVHTLKKGEDSFNGAVVGLGALGIITKVTLKLQPTFLMRQYVFENLPMDQMKDHFEEIMASGYSVSLFTDWQTENINEVWIKCLDDDPLNGKLTSSFFGSIAAKKNMHPIADLSAENCSEQMGIPGPWYERMPHFKMGFTPSNGAELQSEYFVPAKHAVEAILAVARLGKKVGPQLLISEIRAIAEDNLWLSPCYRQSSVAIHFTWKQDWPAINQLLPLIEKELMPYNVKPHWGKLFTISPRFIQERYEKMEDFKKLVFRYDPKGKFRNEFLTHNIYDN